MKKEGNSVIYSNMEQEDTMLSKLSQAQKDKSHMLSHLWKLENLIS
jgi:hypothetical protein